jgi:hypothetical protein
MYLVQVLLVFATSAWRFYVIALVIMAGSGNLLYGILSVRTYLRGATVR